MSSTVRKTKAAMSLAQNVRKLRHDRNLSQVELAKAIGISHPRVSDIERNVGNPTLKTIAKLAQFFGVTEAELITSKKLCESGQNRLVRKTVSL